MSDLYVYAPRMFTDHYTKASRSDVLEWLGWEKCDGLHFPKHFPEPTDFAGELARAQECDDCLDGLVPPASQVEAARGPINKLAYVSHGLARAALIAAMREGGGE